MANEKFVVCPQCEGKGDVDNFGAFSPSDVDEWYGDGPERDEFVSDYFAGNIGRANCDWCKGQRVVPEVDEDGNTAEETWEWEQEYQAERRAEQRMMGIY